MPNVANVRISAALTNYIQEVPNEGFISEGIFGTIPVPNQVGLYRIFDVKRDGARQHKDVRTPGSEANAIDFKFTTGSFRTENHSLKAIIPDEEIAANETGIDLVKAKLRHIKKAHAVNREIATVATLVAGVTISTDPSDEWDDATNGDPFADITLAKQSVQDNSGQTPNVMAMDSKVWDALVDHPLIIDRVKFRGDKDDPGRISTRGVAQLFNFDEILVSHAMKNTAVDGQSASMSRIWGTDVYIFFRNPAKKPNKNDASFAYSFQWINQQVDQWRDVDRKSEIVRDESNFVDLVVFAGAAYRLQNRIG